MSSSRWEHRRARNREYARKKATTSPAARWYASRAWKAKRNTQRALHPWCAACAQMGKTRRGWHVDHVVPHRGDYDLFWHGELQTLCTRCHNSAKQKEEAQGFSTAMRPEDGWPLDPAHPFNRKRRADVAQAHSDDEDEGQGEA